MQPIPQPRPHSQARDLANALYADYGTAAIAGAKTALRMAAAQGDPTEVDLWSEVCGILATNDRITII